MKFSKELQLHHFLKYCHLINNTKSKHKIPYFLDFFFAFIKELFKSKCKQTVLTGISSSKYLILQCFCKIYEKNITTGNSISLHKCILKTTRKHLEKSKKDKIFKTKCLGNVYKNIM